MIERHSKILEIVREQTKVEVVKLSELLTVSQVTIRKDLDTLEDQGLIKREHGYALINAKDDISNRLAYHYQIKQKIAECAAEIVQDGETVMIESGSTCCLLANELAQSKKELTIITNSAFIADYIRRYPDNTIILLGGDYQKEAQVMVGPITRQCAMNFHVDKFFVGTDGFRDEIGFTGNNHLRCETVRDLANQAEHVIIVSESEKFEHKGVVSLIGIDAFSMLITDDRIPKGKEQILIQHNVDVKKAKCK